MSTMLATQHAALRKRTADLEGAELARGVRARVYNSADITLTTATTTALTFDSERYDTDSIHSTSSNTSRLTIPFAGTYRVTGGARHASNATGIRLLQIQLNGTTVIGSSVVQPVNGNVTDMQVTTDYVFAAGDYVELLARQTSGGNLNITAAGNFSPEFWIDRLI